MQATEVVKAGGARDRSYESYRASSPPVVEAIAAAAAAAEGTMVVVHSVVSAACVVPQVTYIYMNVGSQLLDTGVVGAFQVPAPAVNSSLTDDKHIKAVACAPMCAPTPQIEAKVLVTCIRGSSLVVLVEAFGVCDAVQFLIKSRVRFRDKQSKEQAMKVSEPLLSAALLMSFLMTHRPGIEYLRQRQQTIQNKTRILGCCGIGKWSDRCCYLLR